MNTPDLSVIAPCLDEELNVRELARRVLATFDHGKLNGELILVDDGSLDRTRDVIQELEKEFPERVVGRFHVSNQGIAQAWKTGTGAARAPVIAIIDADLQYQPEDLLRLHRELLDYSVDIVQGWRSSVGRERDSRYYFSRGLNVLLNKTFGMDLHDNKSGFVMCAKEVFEDLLTYRGNYYYWQSFIMVAARAKGYSYKEVETLFENRRQGKSFLENVPYRVSARAFVDLGKAAWEYRIKKPPAPVAEHFLARYPVVDRSKPRSPLNDLRWKSYLAVFDETHWMITRGVERHYEALRQTQWLNTDQMRERLDE
jgi:phenylacetate-CoA ligase